MPGLFMDMGLHGGGDVATGPTQPRYGSVPNPSSAMEAAYGPGASVAPNAGLHPGTPPGLVMWVSIAAFVGLVVLYRTAPG